MNLEPELNFCPDCAARLEYDTDELLCPNCGWIADGIYLIRYGQSHGYADGDEGD